MGTEEKTQTQPQQDQATAQLSTAQLLPPEVLEKIQYVYVNNTYLYGSNWDIRFVFAERSPSDKVEPRVGIVMSYQHAKAFLEVFTTQIKNIESAMGEIKYTSPTASAKE